MALSTVDADEAFRLRIASAGYRKQAQRWLQRVQARLGQVRIAS